MYFTNIREAEIGVDWLKDIPSLERWNCQIHIDFYDDNAAHIHGATVTRPLKSICLQDEKRLSLMAARRQQEHEQRVQRDQLRQQWENESKRLSQQKQLTQRRGGEVCHTTVIVVCMTTR